jgi:hypothetical protein
MSHHAVSAPGPGAALVPTVSLVLVLIGIVFAVLRAPQDPKLLQLLWIALPVLALIGGLIWLGARRRSVELDAGLLTVKAGPHTVRLAVAALDLERARIVDLDEHTGLRPSIKTFGTALPGYQAGWFRMRDRWRKAFYLLTQRRRVLWLPGRDEGPSLLLSLEQPQALLEALQDVARRARSR